MATDNQSQKPGENSTLEGPLALWREYPRRLLTILGTGVKATRWAWAWIQNTARGPATQSIRLDFAKAFGHFSSRWILRGALGLAVVIYLLSGTYIVDVGEEALVLRFGRIVRKGIGEGIQYRLPWPFEKEMVVNIAEIRREGLGFQIPEHREIHPPETIEVLSGDENIINVKLIIQYRVKDPADFIFNVDYPSYLLVRDAGKSAIAELAGKMGVDELLTIGKSDLKRRVELNSRTMLAQLKSGIELVNVNIREVAPPANVAEAFRDVTNAREDRARSINTAQGYANSVIPQARGEAQKLIQQARGYKVGLVNRAQGEADAFAKMLAEYRRNSRIYTEDVTRQRLYLETMEKVLNQVKKIVMSVDKGEKVQIRLITGRSARVLK